MLKERHQVFVGLFFLADCVALAASWLGAYMIRFEAGIVPVTKGIPPVYLACAMDMDRDDVKGTIHTLGPAVLGFQELCKQEAMKYPEVRRGERVGIDIPFHVLLLTSLA